MATKPAGGWAFPQDRPTTDGYAGSEGMELRDYFAAAVITGACASPKTWPVAPADLANLTKSAYVIADAMIVQRKS